ncbi:MAG TPA: hypothetical protein ENN46_02800 [Candidatus Woesearchaeota archaeon]|nr:hypothetical protein [Candidatus Woesearchaeota archaeon]
MGDIMADEFSFEELRERVKSSEAKESELVSKVKEEISNYSLSKTVEKSDNDFGTFSGKSYWNLTSINETLKEVAALHYEINRRFSDDSRLRHASKTMLCKALPRQRKLTKVPTDAILSEYSKQIFKLGSMYYSTLEKGESTVIDLEKELSKYIMNMMEAKNRLKSGISDYERLNGYAGQLDIMIKGTAKRDDNFYIYNDLKNKIGLKLFDTKSQLRSSSLKIAHYDQQISTLRSASEMLQAVLFMSRSGFEYTKNIRESVNSITKTFSTVKELSEASTLIEKSLGYLGDSLVFMWKDTFSNIDKMKKINNTSLLASSGGMNPEYSVKVKSLAEEVDKILDTEVTDITEYLSR